jgi:hypothetical protein
VTQETAQRELSHFEAEWQDEALLAKYRDTMQTAASEQEAAEALRLLVESEFDPPLAEEGGPDYGAWKLVFCLSAIPGLEFCSYLVSADPLIGWTAANALRREALRIGVHAASGTSVPAVLRLMYESARSMAARGDLANNSHSSAVAARRRLVYTMGVLQDPAARELLLRIIFDRTEAGIVRSDSARCVLEIAARDPTATGDLLAELAKQVAKSDDTTFPALVRHRICRSSRLTSEFETEAWKSSIRPVLEACLLVEQRAPKSINRDVWVTERWPEVIAHFTKAH